MTAVAEFELWNADKASQFTPWAVAVGALLVALLAAHIPQRLRHVLKPCTGCAARDREIAVLEERLSDPRITWLTYKPEPTETPAPKAGLWVWPGDNTGHLTVRYGDPLDHPVEDPEPVGPPDPETLTEWLAEDQPPSWPPLDAETILIDRLITAVANLSEVKP